MLSTDRLPYVFRTHTKVNVREFDVVLTSSSCRISSILVAPFGPTLAPEVGVINAPLTVRPELGSDPPIVAEEYTSSTHSASVAHSSEPDGAERVLLTVVPLV